MVGNWLAHYSYTREFDVGVMQAGVLKELHLVVWLLQPQDKKGSQGQKSTYF